MILSVVVAAVGVHISASGIGGVSIQAPKAVSEVIGLDPQATGFASLVPASVAGPAALLALFGPAVFRRQRTYVDPMAMPRLPMPKLPQDFGYFPKLA